MFQLHSVLGAVIRFTDHPYFERVWIWQEMCLAKKLVFAYETKLLSFEIFHWLFLRLYTAKSKIMDGRLRFAKPEADSKVESKREAALEGHIGVISKSVSPAILQCLRLSSMDIFLLLKEVRRQVLKQDGTITIVAKYALRDWARIFHATHPKDDVYGLLGLTRHRITVDYSSKTSIGEVFAQDIVIGLEDWRLEPGGLAELRFLRQVGLFITPPDTKPDELVPSWVIPYHFTRKDTAWFTPDQSYLSDSETLRNAASAKVSLENLELHAHGIEIGMVGMTLTDLLSVRLDIWTVVSVLCKSITLLTQNGKRRTYSNKPFRTFFQAASLQAISEVDPVFLPRSLLWLSGLRGGSSWLQFENGQIRFHNDDKHQWDSLSCSTDGGFVIWYAETFSSEDRNIAELEKLLYNPIPEPGELPISFFNDRIPQEHLLDLDSNIGASYLKRTLFTTKSGLIGTCPFGVKQGDVVVVLKGSTTPNLLRISEQTKDVKRWHNVGPCYLPDLIDFLENGDVLSGEAKKFILI